MRQLSYLLLFLLISKAGAQENINYQKPPEEILDLVDVQPAPSVLLDDNKQYMMLLYSNAYKSIEELSREELRLGGLRIDPKTNIGSRVSYYNNVKIKHIKQKNAELIPVKGLPQNPGPTISVNEGEKAQNRTYQDLLASKTDEHNFELLAISEIYKVSLNGRKEKWLGSAMYRNIDFSPDGNYVMVSTINKPFSYLVPYYRFPSKTIIYTKDAEEAETVLKVPLIEDLPKGFMAVRKGRRSLRWRCDKAASLVFVEALDGGDPQNSVEYRDEVFQLDPPFNSTPKSLLKTINRFAGIEWGNTRNVKTYIFKPSDNSQNPVIISDRNQQDRYSDPGDFVTVKNPMGSYVLALERNHAFLVGEGFSEKGQFPFVDKMNLKTLKKQRLYQSGYTDKLERINEFDPNNNLLWVKIESQTEYPNYYYRNLDNNDLKQITFFENPFLSIQSVHKEVISYKREDGLELYATLYLPVGYDKDKKEKMPMILWAYPREYKDKNRVAAGGHSYGAFMVANLLSHSDLFAAGIARSGAYNRTLTPFGFQSEERSYWDSPETYYKMSPFMHADKMKSPLLLVHGEADNNSGTYPLQSRRYFNALKGLGATVRLVMLPKESHGYRAKESILHLLWEQDQWLEKHVKNKLSENE